MHINRAIALLMSIRVKKIILKIFHAIRLISDWLKQKEEKKSIKNLWRHWRFLHSSTHRSTYSLFIPKNIDAMRTHINIWENSCFVKISLMIHININISSRNEMRKKVNWLNPFIGIHSIRNLLHIFLIFGYIGLWSVILFQSNVQATGNGNPCCRCY